MFDKRLLKNLDYVIIAWWCSLPPSVFLLPVPARKTHPILKRQAR